MKFDFWTFAFQIINFTVLVFILRRVLFKPVHEIMEKRRALAAQLMEDAERTKREAEALKDERTKELSELRASSAKMMDEAKDEAAAEKKRLISEAEADAKKVSEKERALLEAEKTKSAAAMKDMAIETVSAYAGALLKDVSDAELHAALVRRFMAEAGRISAEIRATAPKDGTPVQVELESAFPVAQGLADELRTAIAPMPSTRMNVTLNPELIAGIVIRASDLAFDMSLAGQVEALSMGLREKAL